MSKTKRSPLFPERFEVNKTLIFDSHFPTQAMDFKSISTTATATAAATINTPDTDTELLPTSDPKSSAFRSLSYNNGPLLKPHHHHHPLPPPQKAVSYKECLKNHAASLGGHALDGCGEFFPSPISNPSDPTSLKCAACGCHRNFHRRVTYAPGVGRSSGVAGTAHHRVISCSSRGGRGDLHHDMMTSQELIDYNVGGGGGAAARQMMVVESPDSGDRSGSGRKRFRSKFTVEQKEKMLAFAEKLGWKLQRKDLEDEIERFCRSIGVSRQVFKVWMHNHKNLSSSSSASTTANASSLTTQ